MNISKNSSGGGGILLRRYIAQRLADYYAQPSNLVVGAPPYSVDYKNLLGEWHWKRQYGRLYEDQLGQWLTPVELFAPHYSQVMAEHVCRTVAAQQQADACDFEIVELGGGRGTSARGILNHLSANHPSVYERLKSYTIVDGSPTLHRLQQEQLLSRASNSTGFDHDSKLKFALKDLTLVAEQQTPLLSASSSTTPTVCIALELLDNLGHDKVRRDPASRTLEHAVIVDDAEVFRPLANDRLVKEILLKVPSYGGAMGHPTWVPSVACGVLMELVRTRPNCSILLADFDYLPPPDLGTIATTNARKSIVANGEPLVTDMKGIDHDCYLEASSSGLLVDILFPTNFQTLKRFCNTLFVNKGDAVVMKQGKFLEHYGPHQVQATTSRWTGFCPMIHDFYNCSVLTASSSTITPE